MRTGRSRSTSSARSRSRGSHSRKATRARGIELLRAAAAAEDATDKSAVSPGPLAPARELLGYMLLEAERPAEALVEFEATMKKEPNRFRGLYGGARAAEAAGQRARAITLYKQLLQVASEPDTQSPRAPARTQLRQVAPGNPGRVLDPPRGWLGTASHLGPGLIISAAIVGSGELIVTPKVGAALGFSMLWFIILACVVKVFVQIELARLAIVERITTLEALELRSGAAPARVVAALVLAVHVSSGWCSRWRD